MNDIDIIFQICEEVVGLTLTKKSRRRDYIMGRCLFHKYAKKYTDLSLERIGKMTGHDHATVLNSLRKFDTHYRFDDDFRYNFEEINDRLHAYFSEEVFNDKKNSNKTKEIAHLKRIYNIQRKKSNILMAMFLGVPKEVREAIQKLPPDKIKDLTENRIKPYLKLHA